MSVVDCVGWSPQLQKSHLNSKKSKKSKCLPNVLNATQPTKIIKAFSGTRKLNMEMSCNLIVKIAHLPVTGKIALPDTYLRHTLNQEKENLNLNHMSHEKKEKLNLNHMSHEQKYMKILTSICPMMKWMLMRIKLKMYNLI